MLRLPKLQLFAALALAVVLVFTATAVANEVRGTVTAINPDDYTFTVQDELGGTQQLQLRVDGQVMINGQQRTMWDLKVGDRVDVIYQYDEDQGPVATMIRATE